MSVRTAVAPVRKYPTAQQRVVLGQLMPSSSLLSDDASGLTVTVHVEPVIDSISVREGPDAEA
jgi:hypothetical protein